MILLVGRHKIQERVYLEGIALALLIGYFQSISLLFFEKGVTCNNLIYIFDMSTCLTQFGWRINRLKKGVDRNHPLLELE